MVLSFRITTIVLSCLSILATTGCTPGDNGDTTIEPTNMGANTFDSNSELGSRSNPIPLGMNVVVNDWKVLVYSVNRDAFKQVKAADPYSNIPATNERFVLINVKATYVGEESGEPSSDLRFKIVGSKGNTFAKSCGYYSDSFNDNGEAFPGASVTGSLCFIVDADQIFGATISVQGDYSADDRKFLSLT